MEKISRICVQINVSLCTAILPNLSSKWLDLNHFFYISVIPSLPFCGAPMKPRLRLSPPSSSGLYSSMQPTDTDSAALPHHVVFLRISLHS